MSKNWDYLLLFRYLTINFFGICILILCYLNGWIHQISNADPTRIVWVIFLLFIYGMILCSYKIYSTSKEMNLVKNGVNRGKWHDFIKLTKESQDYRHGGIVEALKLKLYGRIMFIKYIGSSLVMLGLIGTVLGFIQAMSGVTPDIVGDINSLGPMVASLTTGMSVALYTTLVGSILNMWLMMNFHILSTGISNLIATILEVPE